jgi:hypothetical protein
MPSIMMDLINIRQDLIGDSISGAKPPTGGVMVSTDREPRQFFISKQLRTENRSSLLLGLH